MSAAQDDEAVPAGAVPSEGPAPAAGDELKLQRTRTSSAWVAAALGAVFVLLMLVFILQNGERVQMRFLWMEFTLPLGAGLLLAGVLGALVVVSLGVGRMLQLRLAARRHRRADRRAFGRGRVPA